MNYTQIANEINNDKIEKWIWWQRKNISNTKWYDTTIKDVLTSTTNAWYTIREFKNEDDWTTEEIISSNDYIKINFWYNSKKGKNNRRRT